MEKEKKDIRKVKAFLRRKGFYIIIMLCVVVITFTTIIITKSRVDYFSENSYIDESEETKIVSLKDYSEEEEISENALMTDEKKKETFKEQTVPVVSKNKSEEEAFAKIEEIKTQQNKVDEMKSEPVTKKNKVTVEKVFNINEIIMPVKGEIIKEFGNEKLIYSKTLKQWSTHLGVDICAEKGTPVKAVAEGKVERIYKDDMLGITVIIVHNNEYKTKYCNLSSIDMVKTGQEVKMGEVINGIGDTALSEKSDGNHLHFEILKENENINPIKYLPIDKKI